MEDYGEEDRGESMNGQYEHMMNGNASHYNGYRNMYNEEVPNGHVRQMWPSQYWVGSIKRLIFESYYTNLKLNKKSGISVIRVDLGVIKVLNNLLQVHLQGVLAFGLELRWDKSVQVLLETILVQQQVHNQLLVELFQLQWGHCLLLLRCC